MVLCMNMWYGLCFWMVIVFVIIISAMVDIKFLDGVKYDEVIIWALLGGVKYDLVCGVSALGCFQIRYGKWGARSWLFSNTIWYVGWALLVVFKYDSSMVCALALFSNTVLHTTDKLNVLQLNYESLDCFWILFELRLDGSRCGRKRQLIDDVERILRCSHHFNGTERTAKVATKKLLPTQCGG